MTTYHECPYLLMYLMMYFSFEPNILLNITNSTFWLLASYCRHCMCAIDNYLVLKSRNNRCKIFEILLTCGNLTFDVDILLPLVVFERHGLFFCHQSSFMKSLHCIDILAPHLLLYVIKRVKWNVQHWSLDQIFVWPILRCKLKTNVSKYNAYWMYLPYSGQGL